ncbi:hypothetical protein ASPFODRAFT_599587 [Aspergillus luchuensis CBS 106.47]|uniref:Uncharacterized protein n=1 Tax=Aspergillus luchuensis (strain CBS 106.47) TaxID=1137211 RepID=A0A1M3TI49_ASPLC|nr:hypothetical protein ASPFODRAFT_599587 [Aspergillus luchuensis CBS 106.47]
MPQSCLIKAVPDVLLPVLPGVVTLELAARFWMTSRKGQIDIRGSLTVKSWWNRFLQNRESRGSRQVQVWVTSSSVSTACMRHPEHPPPQRGWLFGRSCGSMAITQFLCNVPLTRLLQAITLFSLLFLVPQLLSFLIVITSRLRSTGSLSLYSIARAQVLQLEHFVLYSARAVTPSS